MPRWNEHQTRLLENELSSNHSEIVSYLKDHELNPADPKCLYDAVTNNNIGVVALLLKYGANPRLHDSNALQIAYDYNFMQMFIFLVAFGANLNCSQNTIIDSIIQRNDRRWLVLIASFGYKVRIPIKIHNSIPQGLKLYPSSDNTCPICLVAEIDVASSCGHYSCEKCITHWYKTSEFCPICKSSVNDVYRIFDDIDN